MIAIAGAFYIDPGIPIDRTSVYGYFFIPWLVERFYLYVSHLHIVSILFLSHGLSRISG